MNNKSKVFPESYLDLVNIDEVEKINQYVLEEATPLFFGTSELHSKYLEVALVSMLETSPKHKKFQVFVGSSTTEIDQFKMRYEKLERIYHNIRFSFIAWDKVLSEKLLKIATSFYAINGQRFVLNSALRVFIPLVLYKYKHVFSFDNDLIATTDLQNFFEDNYDSTKCIYMALDRISNENRYYFNTGVIVFNVDTCLRTSYIDQLINKMKSSKSKRFLDQDLLNDLYVNNASLPPQINRIGILNYKYNAFLLKPTIIKKFPKGSYELFDLQGEETVKINICHFYGGYKPWAEFPHQVKDNSLSSLWWYYAKKTFSYETFLFDLFSRHANKINGYLVNQAVEPYKRDLDSRLINQGLHISKSNLVEYLDSLSKLSINIAIICSAKDTLKNVQNKLSIVGGRDLTNLGRMSYVLIAQKQCSPIESISSDSQGNSVLIETAIGKLKIKAFSASFACGNNSSIIINNIEYSLNKRGLNFVVIDVESENVIDVTSFDTYISDTAVCSDSEYSLCLIDKLNNM